MLQFTGEYAKKLTRPQKGTIVQELEKAEEEARRLKADGCSAEQILEELKVHYSAEAIRERLKLPPFEEHSAPPHSTAAKSSDGVRLCERTGETPGPTDLIDPHDLYSGGFQHSLTKQGRRVNEVPGYGESWTARKAAIYGMSH
ncbi:hypothetical protein JCM10296v2_005011 [Rhodotorula toruloides]